MTANFGSYINGAGIPKSGAACTTGVLSQVLSSADLQHYLDPNTVNYTVTIPSMSWLVREVKIWFIL